LVYHINKDGSRTRIFENGYYHSGMDKALRLNVEREKKRVNSGEACIIIVDGGLGSGKTNTGVTVARWIQKDFDFKNQVGRGIEQFADAWDSTVNKDSTSEVKACVFDEAHTFNRRGSLTKLNKHINVFLNTFRHTKIILILALPHFADLDSSIYDTQAVRGLVHMKEKHKSFADTKAYDGVAIEDMLDYIDKHRSGRKRFARRSCYNRYHGTYGHIRLPKDHSSIDYSSSEGKDRLISDSMSGAKAN